MSHNPPAALDAFFPLDSLRVMTLRGADASRFAQAQFMNDVAALDRGQWQWSGWLNPKGRVVAFFALLKISEEALCLLLPGGDAAALAQQLRGYVFRSKVQLDAGEDWRAFGSFSAPGHATGAAAHEDGESGWELDLGGDGARRCVRLLRTAVAALPAQNDELQAQWIACDLAHGLPHLAGDQVQAWTPQQLSLDRLRAYSVKKGCYPGQEIVARTHFLGGQAKRGLLRLQVAAESDIAPGASLQAGEANVGTIISRCGEVALAVASLPPPTQALSVKGQPVTALPLLDGLQR